MYSFLFLAIPSVLIWYSLRHSQYTLKQALPAFLTGFLTGIAVCSVQEFIIFSNYYISAHPAAYMFHTWLKETLIPIAVCTGIFLLISRDSKEYKVKMIFTVLAAAYISILPFTVITSGNKHSPFLLIAKPFTIIAMISCISVFTQKVFSSLNNRSRMITGIILIVILSFIPAAIEALWFFKISIILTCTLTVIYFAFSIIVFAGYLKARNALKH